MFIIGCEGYPKFETEYSESYPICGHYWVKNYNIDNTNFDAAVSSYYELFIYSSSLEPEKYVWLNSQTAMETFSFRVITEYNIESLTFNGNLLPHSPTSINPPDSVTKYITIEESMIEQKNWDEGLLDSIKFKLTIYDGNQDVSETYYVLGHRASGQEEPYWDNPQGK